MRLQGKLQITAFLLELKGGVKRLEGLWDENY